MHEIAASWLGYGVDQQGLGPLPIHLFTRREIVRLLRSCGFEIVEVRPLSLQADGRLRCPWWFGRLRSYGYLIAARRPGRSPPPACDTGLDGATTSFVF